MTESREIYRLQHKQAEDAIRRFLPEAVQFMLGYAKDQGDSPTPGVTLMCSVRDQTLMLTLSVYGHACILAPIYIRENPEAAINGWWACVPVARLDKITDQDQWQKSVLFLYDFKDGGKDVAGHQFQKAIADANTRALTAQLGQLDPTPHGALRNFMNVHVEALKRELKSAEAAFKQVPPTLKRQDT